MFETLIYAEHDGIADVVLNRPERRNGITNTMIGELWTVLSDVGRRDDLRVLTLTGAGDWFCPGADIGHFASGAETVRAKREWFAIPVMLHEVPQVTLAAINGPCAGAGLSWACACDVRIAASSAVFNTAFLSVAVPGDMGLPWSLPRLIGPTRARDLMLFPRRFSATEALDYGLLTRVVEAVDLRQEAQRLAEQLAKVDSASLLALKDNIVRAERMSFSDFISLETERHLRISRGSAARDAFKERSTP